MALDNDAFEQRWRQNQQQQPTNIPPPPKPPAEEGSVWDTFEGFWGRAGDDLMDVGASMAYPFMHPVETAKGLYNLATDDELQSQAWEGVKDRASEIASDPVGSFAERPVSTLMDIASVAFPLRGAAAGLNVAAKAGAGSKVAKAGEVAGQVARGLDNLDPTTWMATFPAAVNSKVSAGPEQLEPILKNRTGEFSDRKVRLQTINDAMDRDITPDYKGLDNLDRQRASVGEQIDNYIIENNVQRPIGPLVNGYEDWAKSQIKGTTNERAKILEAIEAKQLEIDEQYLSGPIVSVDSRGLREMRQSADGSVNWNRQNQVDDSAKVQADKLYAHYLREQLTAGHEPLKALNEEMSTLYRIEELYERPVGRLEGNNPVTLSGTLAMGAGMAPSVIAATQGHMGLAGLLMGAAAAPAALNSRAGTLYRNNRARAVENGGLLMRDRALGNWVSDARYGTALIGELMEEEQQRERN